MATKIKKVIATVAALGALAVGGSALAQAGSDQPSPEPQASPQESAVESTAPENSATDPDNIQDESGKDDAQEGNEAGEANEANEAVEAEGKEVPGDDGPGGHADEPGNPNADHQFEGKE